MDMMTLGLVRRYVSDSIANAEINGVEGKSAYEIAVKNGFLGTEEEWLESLKGETPDLTGYYNEANLIALTSEEILEICK